MAFRITSPLDPSSRLIARPVNAVTICLFLLLPSGLAVVGCHRTSVAHATVSSSSAFPAARADARPDSERVGRTLEDYEAALRTADGMRQRVRVADWDLGTRAKELAANVDTIFTFVRDSVRYEPYAGVLRGASGTYMTRAGNAADRALLLSDLLRRKGVATRFALGTLDVPTKDRLFRHTFEFAIHAPSSTVPTKGSHFDERLFQRADHDYDIVRRALGDHLAPVTKPTRQDVELEMNPHVWVQAQVDGAWLDLDPSFLDMKPGMRNTKADSTPSELPDDLYQRLTIRVRKENVVAGQLVNATLLEVQRKTVELADHQIVLTHARPGGGGSMGGLGTSLGQTLDDDSDPWQPTLWISGEFNNGKPLNAGSKTFVAEWLDFDIAWPGGRHEVTSRVLVDRGDAAWRSTKPLEPSKLRAVPRDDEGSLEMRAAHNIWISTGRHNLVDFTDGIKELAAQALLRQVRDEAAAIPGAQREAPPKDSLLNEDDFGVRVWPFVLQNFAWMVWTDHAIVPFVNDTPTLRLYADGPRIAVFSIGPSADDSIVTVSDLRRDDLRGVAQDASQALALSEHKLRYGVIEGALEQEALAELAADAGGDPSVIQTTSSSLSSSGVMLCVPGASAPSLPAGLDAEATARLRATLAAGRTVVAPIAEGRRGGTWWEIADSTLDTRSVGAFGLHMGFGKLPGPKSGYGKPLQANDFGGKVYDIRSKEERLKEARDLAAAARRAGYEERAALQIRAAGAVPQPPAAASETGYTLLLMVGGIIKSMLIDAFAVWMVRNLYLSVEHFVSPNGGP